MEGIEGFIKDDILYMVLYGSTLLLIKKEIWDEDLVVIQPWYKYDTDMMGNIHHN